MGNAYSIATPSVSFLPSFLPSFVRSFVRSGACARIKSAKRSRVIRLRPREGWKISVLVEEEEGGEGGGCGNGINMEYPRVE